MLPSDRLEYEILVCVLAETDSSGYSTNLTTLTTQLQSALRSCTSRETAAAIGRLWQEGNIIVGRFKPAWVVSSICPDIDYLFDGDFRLKASNNSWRRRDSLRHSRKRGVFISHITEEGAIAVLLKAAIQNAFGQGLPVFVSSDTTSIKSGKPWYDEILAHLRLAEIVIVVITKRSIDRRWINFEAGVGIGEDATVIPVVSGGFEKASIGLPLSHLQARDIDSGPDLSQLMEDIASTCMVKAHHLDSETLAAGLAAAARAIPDSDVELKFWRGNNVLKCAVRNNGSKPVRLTEVEVLLPRAIVDPTFYFFDAQPVLQRVKKKIEGADWEGFLLTALPSNDFRVTLQPLPQVLTREMGFRHLEPLGIPLKPSLDLREKDLAFSYRFAGLDVSINPTYVPIGTITADEPK